MKKFNLSLVAVLAMSTFAIAGGDIAPVEPVVEEPMVVESTGAFYLGLGYGAANISEDSTTRLNGATLSIDGADENYSTVMLQAGYKFNPYIAVEGRYWIGLDKSIGNNTDINIDTWGLYVKPMYPVTEAFDIYALLGYASSDASITNGPVTYDLGYDTDGFSWGIGAAYSFNDNVSLFIDYTSMYDDTNTEPFGVNGSTDYDTTLSSWNFGVTYAF